MDGPAAVELREVPEPSRSPQQVLIDVAAAGVNFPDVLQSKGLYQHKPETPFTLGSEVAGTVREVPDGSPLAPGDRVVAFSGTGAFAEAAVADADAVFPLPDNVSFEAGAGLPMNYLTAHFAMVVRGHLEAGQTVLVHGAAGGVGTACVQLAAALGATVIAVVSSDAKAEVARSVGAAHTVPVEGFRDAVKELTGGEGVDVVMDVVGGDLMTDSLRCLGTQGRLLVVGFASGQGIPEVKVNRLLLNNVDVRGVGWGAYAMVRPGYMRKQWDELLPLMESGVIDPPIGATYPLDEFGKALPAMEDRTTLGKSVVTLH